MLNLSFPGVRPRFVMRIPAAEEATPRLLPTLALENLGSLVPAGISAAAGRLKDVGCQLP
jgi:hypothetical protein